MANDGETQDMDDVTHLRRREADERAAAENASCMARTAHEELADEYGDRAESARQAAARAGAEHDALLAQLDEGDRD